MLARVIFAVVGSHDQVKILRLRPNAVVMELGKKTTFALAAWDEARGDELASQLKSVIQQYTTGPLVVGLAGGTDRARRLLKKARPLITEVRVGQVHVDDGGDVWTRDADLVQRALSDFQRTPPLSEQEWARFLEKSAVDMADFADRVKTARGFAAALDSRRPVATLTLAGIILGVFGLEFAFGGTQSPPVLLRMGALSPERVLAGEVWRLFSCTFLHSGLMHVLCNTYVLWVLGSFLERVIGTWRFLVLYGLACTGASLVSLAFLDGFSVGASGGLWGLLGAHAVLAWRSQGLFPSAMIRGARRAAAFNLGINVLISFLPFVDMWAHFGGGAVGAALMLSGALTRSLPRIGELADDGRLESAGDATVYSGPALKVTGSAVAAVLLVGLGLGLSTGRPWALRQPVERVRTDLPGLGISLSLPEGLELTPSPPGEQPSSVKVGDVYSDPGALVVTSYPADMADQAALAREYTALVKELEKAPPGARLAFGPDDVSIAGGLGVSVRYRYDNDTEEELAFIFLNIGLLKVNTLRWPAFGEAVPQGYATKVLESLLPLFEETITAFRRRADQGDPEAQNNLAWLLSTCREPAYLDGREAIKYALMAVAQVPDEMAFVDTLAAAYARAGDFPEAVKAQERALELLSDEGSPRYLENRRELEGRLESYKQGEAYTAEVPVRR